jgi:hypothetical protein
MKFLGQKDDYEAINLCELPEEGSDFFNFITSPTLETPFFTVGANGLLHVHLGGPYSSW